MYKLSSGSGKKPLALFFLALFALMLFFNFCTPLLADDYNYCYVWACDNLRLEHPSQIIPSMNAHRLFTNGRVFSHAMVQFFLIYNKAIFNFVNAAMQCLLALSLYSVFKRFSPRPLLSLTVLYALVFIFAPSFGQVFIWLDGAVNYSWGVLVLLLFLQPFFFHYLGKPIRENRFIHILYIIEAFLAGAYSENGSAAALFCCFILLIMIYVRYKKLPLYLLLSFFSGCGGFLYLLSAPCLQKGERGQFSFKIILSLISAVFSKIHELILAVGPSRCVIGLILVIAAAAYLYIVRKRRKLFYFSLIGGISAASLLVFVILALHELQGSSGFISALGNLISSSALNLLCLSYVFCLLFFLALYFRCGKDVLSLSALLFASGAVSLLVFIFAAYLPGRSALHYTFYLGIASVFLLNAIYSSGGKKFVKAFLVIFLLLFLLCFILGFADIINLKVQSDARLEIIGPVQGSAKDVELPILNSFTKYSPVSGLQDLDEGPGGWINDMFSVYYGLGQVSGINLT